jgi:hypothetical protein
MSAILALTACTTTIPSPAITSGSSAIRLEEKKIKNMTPISYQYKSESVGCTEIKFLEKFVGKQVKADDGSIVRVDNIHDIHSHEVASTTQFWVFVAETQYDCSFWGYAVEYEK